MTSMDNIRFSNKIGWVKLHRQLLEWRWIDDHNTLILFIHLLLMATHKPHVYRGVELKPGQIITSYRRLADQTGLSVRSVRTSINRLKSTHEVTHQATQLNSLITINNWNAYQSGDTVADNQTTHERHTSDTASNKNEKNVKEWREDARAREALSSDSGRGRAKPDHPPGDDGSARLNSCPVPPDLQTPEFSETYRRYLQYSSETLRRDRSPLQTEEDFRRLVELQALGNEPVKVIRQTIQAGHRVFYPLKDEQYKKKSEEDEWNEEIIRRQKDCPMMN